jgi:hypothetical protein
MPSRKAALIGGHTGPWIATSEMKNPHLDVVAGDQAFRIIVSHCNASKPQGETSVMLGIDRAGEHKLARASWIQVHVMEGDPKKLLCILIDKAEAA